MVALLGAGGSVLLSGVAGVGKSRFADEMGSWAESEGWCTIRLRATAGTSEVPFGVFQTLAFAGDRSSNSMFTDIRDGLLKIADGRRLLLIVDDVYRLDESSAALLHQFVGFAGAQALMVIGAGMLPPPEVADLAVRGVLQRIYLDTLDGEQCGLLADAMAGVRLTARTRGLLWVASGGSPLLLRELLLAVNESSPLVRTSEGFEVKELPVSSMRLNDLIWGRLSTLSDEAKAVLLLVAFGEPLGLDELAGPSDSDVSAALAELENAGLVQAEAEHRRLTVRLVHPLYGEVLRAGTPMLAARRVLAELCRNLEAAAPLSGSNVIKLARLALESDTHINPEILAEAAILALHSHDRVLAGRLARAAHDEIQDFSSGWSLAIAMYFDGDRTGFRQHCATWPGQHATPDQRAAQALIASWFDFFLQHDAVAAFVRLDDAIAMISNEVAVPEAVVSAAELRAARARLESLCRNSTHALSETQDLLENAGRRTAVRATVATIQALVLLARPADALLLLERNTDDSAVFGAQAAAAAGRIQALFELGRFADAADSIDGIRKDHVDSAGVAFAAITEALLLVSQGRTAAAVRSANRADSWIAEWPAVVPRRWSLIAIAFAQASDGQADAARMTLELLEKDNHPASMLDAYLWRAKAWQQHAAGFPIHARSILHDGAENCRDAGDLAGEMNCLHDLTRLGDATFVVKRMTELGALAQGDLFATMVANTIASATKDQAALVATADAFEKLTAYQLAAEAFAEAANLANRSGNPRAATRMAHRANAMLAMGERNGAKTTSTVSANITQVPLSRRERDVAVLAAKGLQANVIGERLYISGRTVESHIARIYTKLGVTKRAELAEAINA